jgi:polyferredoxin
MQARKYKKSQLIMLWLLPLIVIGGLFNNYLGYLVIAMMTFLLILAFFKKRYWCWNLCPRGAFLDLVVGPLSKNKKIPKFFFDNRFRIAVFAALISFLVIRILSTGGNLKAIGLIFVSMCLVTTILAFIMGLFFSKRAWCSLCPMGFLQEQIHNLNKTKKK